MKCDFCGSEVSNKSCAGCLSMYRRNLDLLLILMFFFSLPSIFLIKGTGNLYFLLSSLIGAIIYLFNSKMVLDEEATFRGYESVKREVDILTCYLSEKIGLMELINESKKANSIIANLYGSDVIQYCKRMDTLVEKPTSAEQVAHLKLEKSIPEIRSSLEEVLEELNEKLRFFLKYHRGLLEKYGG